MAKKQTTKEEDKNITRISASPSNKSKKVKETKEVKEVKTEKTSKNKTTKNKVKKEKASFNEPSNNPFVSLWRYFRGSWHELKQVHWPDRKATWSLTIAVIIFTVFIALLVLGLDMLFRTLFEQILR